MYTTTITPLTHFPHLHCHPKFPLPKQKVVMFCGKGGNLVGTRRKKGGLITQQEYTTQWSGKKEEVELFQERNGGKLQYSKTGWWVVCILFYFLVLVWLFESFLRLKWMNWYGCYLFSIFSFPQAFFLWVFASSILGGSRRISSHQTFTEGALSLISLQKQ